MLPYQGQGGGAEWVEGTALDDLLEVGLLGLQIGEDFGLSLLRSEGRA